MDGDVLIIGGGIAGASLAFHLAARRRVLLLEREGAFGVHATGRSAAEWSMVHATGMTRALTGASRDFLLAPPKGFGDTPLLRARGNVIVARAGSEPMLERLHADAAPHVPKLTRIDAKQVLALAPFVAAKVIASAIYDPTNCAIDVDALLNSFLRAAREQNAVVRSDVAVLGGRPERDGWRVETSMGSLTVAAVVNAAGAWADDIALSFGVPALGLTPRRRTAITFEISGIGDLRGAAALDDVATGAYLKPEGGSLMASPGDATISPACDAAPEEIDVATAAWIAEELTGRRIERLQARWAGLRTCAADEQPVAGWEASVPGFFWLAGLGGAGLMTSPALGAAAAAILMDGEAPSELRARGITATDLSPQREQLVAAERNRSATADQGIVSSAAEAGSLLFGQSARLDSNVKQSSGGGS